MWALRWGYSGGVRPHRMPVACQESALSGRSDSDPSYSRCGSLFRLVGPGEVRLQTALPNS
eukprot:6544382-Prymnesium_polylepis.1